MPFKILGQGNLRFKVQYSVSYDARNFNVTIDYVEYVQSASDIKFYAVGPYYLSCSGNYNDTWFRISNVDSPPDYNRHVDTDTTYTFDRYTNSSSSTNVTIQFQTDHGVIQLPIEMAPLDSYDVTYDGGMLVSSAYNIPSKQTKWYTVDLTLSNDEPYSTYGTFKNWNTDVHDEGTRYNPGATYRENNPVRLYAIWDYAKYTISYNANGGSSAPSNQTKVYNTNIELSTSEPRRTGYTFKYWYTNSSGSGGTIWHPGDTYSKNENLTLYAIWDLIYYTITYYDNYGSGNTIFITQQKPYGESVTLTTRTPSRSYYNFDRWNINSSGTGSNYQPGATYSSNNDLELYAIWTPKEWEIVYSANGGSGAPASQIKVADVDLRLSTDIPVRAGYTFSCWARDSTNPRTAVLYAPGDYFTGNTGATLYAIWTPGIFYDANGGSGAPSVQPILDTRPITLSTVIPVRDNHTFLYWNTSRNDTGTRYNPGDTYTPANVVDNVFMYAIWRRDPDRPTISAMLVTRRNASGVLDDEGTYMYISVTWNVDTVRRAGNVGVCYLYYKLSSSSSWTSLGITDWDQSATSTIRVGGISTDEQYDIKANVYDADNRMTERVDILTRAKFVWDVAVGGEAMGIGSAAPSSGLEIGWVTQLDENVTVLKNLSVTGTITTPNLLSAPNFEITNTTDGIITSSTYWTVSGQVVYLTGALCSIAITLSPPRQYDIGEVNDVIATINTQYRPIVAHSFGTYWGLGYIDTQGKIYFRNHAVISDSSQLQIGLTYIRQQPSIEPSEPSEQSSEQPS